MTLVTVLVRDFWFFAALNVAGPGFWTVWLSVYNLIDAKDCWLISVVLLLKSRSSIVLAIVAAHSLLRLFNLCGFFSLQLTRAVIIHPSASKLFGCSESE